MFISVILAWLTVVFAVLAAFKFIARKSGNKKLNMAFHKVHIRFGVLMVVCGALHALFAGNPASATLTDFTPFAAFLPFNWGTACLLFGVGLALTYVYRLKLKKAWMRWHRIFTVAMLLCLVMHIVSMGITLPSFFESSSETAQTQVTDTVTSDSTASAGVSADTSTAAADSETTAAASSDSASSAAADSASTGSVATFSGATLADGSYEGSAQGYSGTTTVSVTVSGGKVTAIDVVSESDSPQFFSRAEAILDTIISGQSLEVDTVSSATFSSAGLLNATYNALQQAVTSGTLQVTSVDLSSVQRGH